MQDGDSFIASRDEDCWRVWKFCKLTRRQARDVTCNSLLLSTFCLGNPRTVHDSGRFIYTNMLSIDSTMPLDEDLACNSLLFLSW